MKLLERLQHRNERGNGDRGAAGPQPQPERFEPRLRDPTLTKLSRQDYVAIVKRSIKEAGDDNLTSVAAALAYYAFLAIPSVLMVAVGTFALVGDRGSVGTLVDKLGEIIPGQAQTLLRGSLTTLTQNKGTGITVLVIGVALALWSLTGAMQNIMWGINLAYERDETRGFLRRRTTALAMVGFAGLGVILVFGLLVLGPHLTTWIGDSVGHKTLVHVAWWAGQWPILIVGLLVAIGGIYYLAPNVKHPRLQFLTIGAVLGVLIWLALSGLFAFYASRFGSYNKTWGSLSVVVVMLTWLWLSSLVLLLGAEINAEAERTRELRQGQPAQVNLQAPPKN
jgi:membrane protein